MVIRDEELRFGENENEPLLKKVDNNNETVYEVDSSCSASPLTSDSEDGLTCRVKHQTWNNPSSNIGKTIVVFIGFITMGMFDAALGTLLPKFEEYFQLTDFQVSIALLAPFIGYLISAVINNWVHYQLGRGGLSILGVGLMLFNFCVASLHPPYWIMLLGFALGGLGSGLVNGSWNAWIGAFKDAHGILGVVQGCFSIGAMIGPSVCVLILENGLPWYWFYRILAVIAVIVLVFTIAFFKKDGPLQYRLEVEDSHRDDEEGVQHATVWDALKNKNVILLSVLLYAYQGTEMSLSDWIVTYMIRNRHGNPNKMGLMSSCLWMGLTGGRIGLGFVTGRFKDHQKVQTFYLCCALVAQVLFWGIHNIAVSAVTIFFVGFFTGPMYPSAMIMATNVLPKRLHVPGICAAVALSGTGSASLPVVFGYIVERFGAWIIQPVVFGFLVFLITLWSSLPNKPCA